VPAADPPAAAPTVSPAAIPTPVSPAAAAIPTYVTKVGAYVPVPPDPPLPVPPSAYGNKGDHHDDGEDAQGLCHDDQPDVHGSSGTK
jgi:hypothetical protein